MVALVLCVFVYGGCERKRAQTELNRPSTSPRAMEQLGMGTTESTAPLSRNSPTENDPVSFESDNITVNSNPISLENATTEQLREAALQALESGQDDLAFELVRQAKRVAPNHPDVVFLYAMVLGDRHRFYEAIKILDQFAAHTPAARLPALGRTAEWMAQAGRYGEAAERYRQILAEVPNAPMVHHHLGQLLLQLGKRTEASLHLQFLAQLGALQQEELRSLLTLSKPFPQDEETNRLEPLNDLARARQEMALNHLDIALELLGSSEVVGDAEASLKARIQARQKNFDSLRQWATSHELLSGDADGWFAAGSLAASTNSHSEAIRCFCRTLLIDQTDAEAYQMLSESLRAVDESAAAKEANKRAELIRQTQEIGAQLTIGKGEDRARIARLIVLLEQLNRPLEVLGWQSVDLVYAVGEASMTGPEAERAFEAIGRKRDQLVRSGRHQMDASFVLCGLDINNYRSKAPGS